MNIPVHLSDRRGMACLAHAYIILDFTAESQSLFGQIELHRRKDVTPNMAGLFGGFAILLIGWRL